MSKAMGEEVIAALWTIAAILCFGFRYDVPGWFFGLAAVRCFWCGLKCAYREYLQDREKE